MIQGLLVKLIFKAVIKAVNRRYNMRDINRYVKEDNELDIKVKSLFEKRTEDLLRFESINKMLNKYGMIIEELEKENAILKQYSHEPIFTKKDRNDINKSISTLTKRFNKLEHKWTSKKK